MKNSFYRLFLSLGLFGSFVDDPDNSGKGTGEPKKVEITQDKLDSLINGKFKDGATKATKDLLETLGAESVDQVKTLLKAHKDSEDSNKSELQKIVDANGDLTKQIGTLTEQLANAKSNTQVSDLAAKHGIKEVDYFKHVYSSASKAEGFNEETFITELLAAKGELLTGKPVKKGMPNPGNVNHEAGDKIMLRSEFEKMDPVTKRKFFKDGGKLTDE